MTCVKYDQRLYQRDELVGIDKCYRMNVVLYTEISISYWFAYYYRVVCHSGSRYTIF